MVIWLNLYIVFLMTSILSNLSTFIDFVTVDVANEIIEIKPPALTTYIILLISVILYPIMILAILKEDM